MNVQSIFMFLMVIPGLLNYSRTGDIMWWIGAFMAFLVGIILNQDEGFIQKLNETKEETQ